MLIDEQTIYRVITDWILYFFSPECVKNIILYMQHRAFHFYVIVIHALYGRT